MFLFSASRFARSKSVILPIDVINARAMSHAKPIESTSWSEFWAWIDYVFQYGLELRIVTCCSMKDLCGDAATIWATTRCNWVLGPLRAWRVGSFCCSHCREGRSIASVIAELNPTLVSNKLQVGLL